jgi:site-specific DNA-cytosine methylase
MKVLVACEYSGRVRDAFTRLGHDAVSVDLLPTETEGRHIQGDVLDVLESEQFDLMVAFPPCTHLAVSGARYFEEKRADGRQQSALAFVQSLMDAPVERIALENPVGIISSAIRKPDQIIQPWMFGEDASKKTCLWLKNLPKLEPTKIIRKDIYANQTPSGQNKLGPSEDRAKIRSLTYQGIADVMAEQWGSQETMEGYPLRLL